MKGILTFILTCFFTYVFYKFETVLLKSKAEKSYEELTMSPVSIIVNNIGHFVVAIFVSLGLAGMIVGGLLD